MTETQKQLVQSTWESVVPISSTAADLFYTRLFELDPQLKALFSDDLSAQKQKLMTMIGAAVRGLDDLEKLVPVVEDLGKRHVRYGVKMEHYDTVGAALLWTLGQGLGEAFTDEVKEAWTVVYSVLATTMQGGAAVA